MSKLNYLLWFSLFFMSISTSFLYAQEEDNSRLSITTNHVYSVTFLDPVSPFTLLVLEGDTPDFGDSKITEKIDFYDGFGNLYQSRLLKANPDLNDITSIIDFDDSGRETKNYLPFVNSTNISSYSELVNDIDFTTAFNEAESFYNTRFLDEWTATDIINPYSQRVLEPSPLNRVLEQAAPGKDWAVGSGHTIKFDYKKNTINEVKQFNVGYSNGNDYDTHLVYDNLYLPNQLYKTVTKDENWTSTSGNNHTTEEFKNKQGQVLLKRTYNENQPHDTYYVYDDFGNLTYVLPPEASDEVIANGSQGFRITSQTNYPWTDLVLVDKAFADEYNKNLEDYENDAILNADIQNQYEGQGGFTVNTHQDQDLVTLSITFSANTPFALKQGELVSLKEYGQFQDTELGKISGIDFEYVFIIKNNAILVEKSGKGDGELTSINELFNSTIKLSYTQNYPWTTYTDVDPKFAADYEKQLSTYPNSDILGVNISNEYGGQGGLNISIDQNDNVFFTFNSSTTTPLKLKQGLVIPLDAKRKLDDRDDFDTFQGYILSIKDNNLHIRGKNTLTSFNWTCGTHVPTLPPATVEGLCYIYHYDYRNRLIEKKIPGKDWEYIVYDKLDRPILTQNANLRLNNDWLFTKYDAFSRVVYTGKYHFVPSGSEENSGRKELQDDANDQVNLNESKFNHSITDGSDILDGITLEYTHESFPNNNLELFTINYYDDYILHNIEDLPYSDSYGQTLSTNNKSLSTVSKVRVLGTDNWITTVTYYDHKARPIYSISKNDYLNTVDWVKTNLDFVGKVLETTTHHEKTNQPNIEIIDAFTYDSAQRLLTQSQTIDDNTELIVNNHYDELGQLENKNVGGAIASSPEESNGLQTIDYKYNIRGWLKSINNISNLENDLFGFELKYNDPNANALKLYNGNISESHWITANDNTNRNYRYYYDDLNRILKAVNIGPSENSKYQVSNISYDKNGNLQTLNRNGWQDSNIYGAMDVLIYNYEEKSNKLKSVLDNGNTDFGFIDKNTNDNDYQYDSNGNMTVDKNKKILKISYNHLNLPIEIEFDKNDDLQPDAKEKINYIYDATGVKLEKIVRQGPITSTKYAGNYIYKEDATGETLKFFNHPEGYVEPDNLGSYKYVYQYKDHLGNIRLSYAENITTGELEIIEENNYYPFGLEHKGYNNVINGTEHPYKYNGKEHEEELGYDMYDFDMRHYDPAIARWVTVDPKAELMRRYSPYNFAFDNPIRFIDPDGMAPEDVILKGKEKQAAFNELQASVSSELTLSMDKGGKVSYTQNGTGKLSKDAQQLTSAIDDSSVTVNVNAENTKTTASGDLYIGGAFSGNTVAKDASGNTTVTAEQEINPGVLNKMSTGNGKPGADVLHEVTEAYQGALISEKKGISSGAANKPGTVYKKAHKKATSQSGKVYETLYDGAGKVLNMTPSGGYPAGVKSVQWSVKNKGKTTIIQTLK